MTTLDELTTKLREIFQIDRPDLDFGIYRIMNSRAKDMDDYLRRRLPAAVKAAFPAGNDASEAAVYNHLLTFFARYYDAGDFISQRRYKGDTYAIPYSGEEVMLHWANKDQYYTKSGENFSNYRFTLDDGRSVVFRLIAADTAKDNRKDNNGSRLFTLVQEQRISRTDDDGNEYEETLHPLAISDDGSTLEIHFTYRQVAEGKQDKENDNTRAQLRDLIPDNWQAVWQSAPTEKDPKRPLLGKHLTDYTRKNSADYFIHKDLGGFLRRELDYYIKNEVMQLDNIQDAADFTAIERDLRLIQTLRHIARDIINFLAQLENFQKKLWLKKKFVAACHWLITLNHIPEHLLDTVFNNEKQLAAWKNLFAIKELPPPLNFNSFVKSNPYLIVDTSLYPPSFQAELLSELSLADDLPHGLDAATDGLLIHADNFQALQLLQTRYREQVKCIYIDPPYNTNSSEILYKNGYKHSSWLSLLLTRIELSITLLKSSGNLCATIDDVEKDFLTLLLDETFGEDNQAGIISIRINPSGRPSEKGFALTHEYALFYKKSRSSKINRVSRTEEQLSRFNQKDENGIFEFRNLRREGSNSDRIDGQKQYYPIFADLNAGTIRIPRMQWIESQREWILNENCQHNETVIYPITDEGREKNWRWSEEHVREDYSQFLARIPRGGIPQIYYKYRPKTLGTTPLTLWIDSKYSATEHGTILLKNLFSFCDFSYPKSIFSVIDCIGVSGAFDNKRSLVLDYFAGSGTTAHAVINLNREDGGKRKYILVEQGEYFDTVLKPRVQKVIYSENWTNGKPQADKDGDLHGVPQIVKVLQLESYEDTLNNLTLARQDDVFKRLPEAAQEDYLLRYMLTHESRDSLLSTDDFKHPFAYRLNIATSSAGSYESRVIDLVETFNYLLGISVQAVDDQRHDPRRQFVFIEGRLPNGENCLIVWRDCERWDYQQLPELLKKRRINPNNHEFDVIYINGDHNIPTVLQEADGIKTLKLRPIEPEFLSLMFDVEDV